MQAFESRLIALPQSHKKRSSFPCSCCGSSSWVCHYWGSLKDPVIQQQLLMWLFLAYSYVSSTGANATSYIIVISTFQGIICQTLYLISEGESQKHGYRTGQWLARERERSFRNQNPNVKDYVWGTFHPLPWKFE